jgi:hypothetical protein
MKNILWYGFSGLLLLVGFAWAFIAFSKGEVMDWVLVGIFFVGAWKAFERAGETELT